MDLLSIMISVVIALLTSSGFWVFLEKRTQRYNEHTKLLMGLAHDRITYLALTYINRGYILHDEHENLIKYLYLPYQKLGGNGTTLRIIEEINKLPMKQRTQDNSNNTKKEIK